MKRFLFVTYYFPPAGGPAVQRIIRIVQHLARMGWQCTVLTVRNGEYTSLDPQLEQNIPPETHVIRTDIFEPYRFYRKFIGKKPDEKIPLAVLASHEKAGWKEKIANTIRANLFIPDARIGWYNYGVKAGVKAVQDDPSIKLILSSGPPHTVHLIGNKIAKKMGLPFVADFRDPWVNIDYYHDIKRSRFTLSLDRYLEGKILSRADAVITVSPGCEDLLVAGHKNMDHDRFHVIYNGFDAEVYPDPMPEPPDDKFIITYIGNLPRNRYTPVLFQAIAELKKENKIAPEKFQLRFFGNIDRSVHSELAKFNIDDLLQVDDFIPHQQAIMRICQSHLLLLLINNTKTRGAIVTGKLFEYLASRRRIFAIGPTDGDAANILAQTGTGSIFEYEDEEGMKDFLFRKYQEFQHGKWQPISGAQIDKYERSNQLKQLAAIFEKVSR